MSMNPNKVIIPCRFSYLHCWEPDSVNGGDPKYSVSAIIPKGDTKTIEKIRAAVENAKKESLSKWGGKIPPNLKLPLRDGDIERPDDEAYEGVWESRKWSRIETFGGKLTENIVQATARDLLAEAMLRLRDAGLEIVMHVHDEAVLEVPIGHSGVDEVCALMAEAPAWADGLPLRADGYECEFYKKD